MGPKEQPVQGDDHSPHLLAMPLLQQPRMLLAFAARHPAGSACCLLPGLLCSDRAAPGGGHSSDPRRFIGAGLQVGQTPAPGCCCLEQHRAPLPWCRASQPDLLSNRPSNNNGLHTAVPQTRYLKLREQIQSPSSPHLAFSLRAGLKGKAGVSSAACVHNTLLAAL